MVQKNQSVDKACVSNNSTCPSYNKSKPWHRRNDDRQ